MNTVSEGTPAHQEKGTVKYCFYGIVRCALHTDQVRCGIFMQTGVKEVDRTNIDLDQHTDFVEDIDEDTLEFIKRWSHVDMSVAMKKAQSVMSSRAEQTLSGRNIEKDYTMTDEEERYVASYCNGKLCWPIRSRFDAATVNLEDEHVPSVFFFTTTVPCRSHKDQRKVVGVFRTNIHDQTVKESIITGLRVNSLDPQVRSAIWHKDRTEARLILEEHFLASVTLVLRKAFEPHGLDHRVCLMIPPPDDVDLLRQQTGGCNGSECSIQDSADRNTASTLRALSQ